MVYRAPYNNQPLLHLLIQQINLVTDVYCNRSICAQSKYKPSDVHNTKYKRIWVLDVVAIQLCLMHTACDCLLRHDVSKKCNVPRAYISHKFIAVLHSLYIFKTIW